jgi:hypothetical protein
MQAGAAPTSWALGAAARLFLRWAEGGAGIRSLRVALLNYSGVDVAELRVVFARIAPRMPLLG